MPTLCVIRLARRTVLALAVCATSGLGAQAPRRPDRAALRARVDSLAGAFLREAPATGLTLAVVRGADTLVHQGYGMADVERRRPAGPGTVYRVGSITKQFTAAAVLQLVDQGKLSLDDTLGRVLPRFRRWSGVTIRQLLNHTSGIHSYTASRAWQTAMATDLRPDSVLGFVARDTFDFAPGAAYRYNNTGYMLLGLVLEERTGMPYDRYVTERFFRPLGMRTASYCPSQTADTAHASGYDRRGPGAPVPAQPISMTSPYAAGALCMSVGDFLIWHRALSEGRIVTPATFARMITADSLRSGQPIRYGWGLAPDTLAGRPMIQHGGDINGFSAQQLWVPRDSLRVVVFTNTLGSNPSALARNVARAALGVPLVDPRRLPPAVPLPAERRAMLVGTYELKLPDGTVLPLTVASGPAGLTAQAPGQPAIPLVHVGDDTFGAAFDPSLRLRLMVENGRAVSAVLRQGGGTIAGPRRP